MALSDLIKHWQGASHEEIREWYKPQYRPENVAEMLADQAAQLQHDVLESIVKKRETGRLRGRAVARGPRLARAAG